jgi:hypothetical protein
MPRENLISGNHEGGKVPMYMKGADYPVVVMKFL